MCQNSHYGKMKAALLLLLKAPAWFYKGDSRLRFDHDRVIDLTSHKIEPNFSNIEASEETRKIEPTQ